MVRTQSSRLIPYHILLAMILSLAAALGTVFYQQQLLKQITALTQPNYLSLIYMRILTEIYPENMSLRLDLVDQQRKLGYLDQAIKTLQPLFARNDAIAIKARYLAIHIQMEQIYAQNSVTEEQVKKLQRSIKILRDGDFPLSAEILEQLAKFCLELSRPELAADFYIQLAKKADIPLRSSWFATAGRWYLASGQPGKASEAYHQAFITTQDVGVARDYALLVLNALHAGDKTASTLEQVRYYLDRYPKDRELLEQAISLALAAGQLQQALALGYQRLALDPDDLEQISRQLERALAIGALDAAFGLAQQGIKIRPEDLAFRHRLVQVAKWGERPGVALEQLLWLAQHNPTEKVLEEALNLARGLALDPVRIQVLESLSQLRPLKPMELQEALDAFVRLGDDADGSGITFLEEYLARYPEQAEAWQKLAWTQEQAGQFRAAVVSWKQIEIRFGWSSTTARRQAELLWQAGDRLRAFLFLEKSYNRVPSSDTAFWKVFGEQAWTLDRLESAWAAYQNLFKTRQANQLVMERLIILAHKTSRLEEAVSLSEGAFQRYSEPRLLLLGIDMAMQGERWQDVERLLKIAKEGEGQFLHIEFYWLLRAQAAIHSKKLSKASIAYRRALDIEPQSATARVGFLWLLIDSGDMRSLAQWLLRWKGDADRDSAYWSVYAIGLTRLGRAQEALVWFDRQAQTNPHDFSLLLSYADALGQAGKNNAEWRLRQHILWQIRAEQRGYKIDY